MKSYKAIIGLLAMAVIAAMVLYACRKSFLTRDPIGQLGDADAATKKGVEELLIGAYAVLDGNYNGFNWQSSCTNWVYGSIAGGDAHKGSNAGDQADVNPIERYEGLPTNEYFNTKWKAVYDGVARSNNVLKSLALADVSDEDRVRIRGEARFLRGYYHLEAKKMWNNIPYVDETIDYVNNNYKVGNTEDAWPRIEADLKAAYDSLPELMGQIGRANKWVAAAFLAKAYMFQKKYAEAKPILESIIASGVNPRGTRFGLEPRYQDNYNAETKNGRESIFAVQASVNDGGGGNNANPDQILNFPHNPENTPGGCCGFFQPTQELVNSYRTDANGLPLLDGSYNEGANQVKSDQGILATDPFTPDAGRLDPRLDWVAGRRGIPYLDWGNHPGASWIRDQGNGGPYSPKKNVYYKSQEKVLTDGSSWTNGLTAINYILVRYADVLLWAAECEVEIGSLEKAREYVNMVRERAMDDQSWVKKPDGTPAANYVIGTYDAAWTDQAAARRAVHFERKLELAMEGHRFFDLVRWGEASSTLNAYIAYETSIMSLLRGAQFREPKNLYYPIPQRQIDLSATNGVSALEQNPDY
ncbi:RagB/SusD family nutrient uptake outer membrane protein [Chitinophaga japonensis]|uniref:Putative outer membrane starch-binding protein n=1 Tax=Chitinophaga japonensis TaxID=104662 RepID=A0A562TCW8_CHIJA|nr:RagB/SusD family nutrient uptake outer membrane protein [Chitinophaga japonensis]TWI91094.1 putative outer membrane starch-binding protein [Chitinophaga japonensis]